MNCLAVAHEWEPRAQDKAVLGSSSFCQVPQVMGTACNLTFTKKLSTKVRFGLYGAPHFDIGSAASQVEVPKCCWKPLPAALFGARLDWSAETSRDGRQSRKAIHQLIHYCYGTWSVSTKLVQNRGSRWRLSASHPLRCWCCAGMPSALHPIKPHMNQCEFPAICLPVTSNWPMHRPLDMDGSSRRR